jgi:pyruvate formate lyase activating enzyme
MEPGPLEQLLGVVDAMNIDIKSMDPAFYRGLCKARLEPVLKTCETVKKHAHLEVTNLLIPGENDDEENVRALVRFIADNLGRDTPLHISRYFPRHRMSHPPTPEHALLEAWRMAAEELDYVYLGNVSAGEKADTHCPGCGTTLVNRRGYATRVTSNLVRDEASEHGKCRACGHRTNMVIGS